MNEQEVLYSIKMLKAEKEKLEAENQELAAKNRLLHAHEDELRDEVQRQYMRGLVDALVFALRCQSIYGAEIKPPEWSRP